MKAILLLLLVVAGALAQAQAQEEETVVLLHDVAGKHLRASALDSEQAISQQAITAAVASACSLTPPYQLGAEEAKQVRGRSHREGAACCPQSRCCFANWSAALRLPPGNLLLQTCLPSPLTLSSPPPPPPPWAAGGGPQALPVPAGQRAA